MQTVIRIIPKVTPDSSNKYMTKFLIPYTSRKYIPKQMQNSSKSYTPQIIGNNAQKEQNATIKHYNRNTTLRITKIT